MRVTCRTSGGERVYDVAVERLASPTTLAVPVSVHAAFVRRPIPVLGPSADFSRLPWSSPEGDVGARCAYLAENIATQPFEGGGFQLSPGVHLHWILPGALRHGSNGRALLEVELPSEDVARLNSGGRVPRRLSEALAAAGHPLRERAEVKPLRGGWILDPASPHPYRVAVGRAFTPGNDTVAALRVFRVFDTRLSFPGAPDRWLVRRLGDRERRWIVQSDAVRPHDDPEAAGCVAYPAPQGHAPAAPFVRLGRVLDYDAWLDSAAEPEERVEMTAVGYGEPTFAAFYPNCYSVFGFHDAEAAEFADEAAELYYQVVGWYSEHERDPLQSVQLNARIDALASRYHWRPDRDERAPEHFRAIRFDALSEDFQLPETAPGATLHTEGAGGHPATAAESEGVACPESCVFVGKAAVHVAGHSNDGGETSPFSPRVEVALGATATEALSAYLADEIGETAGGVLSVDEQLEAVHLTDHLDDRASDLMFRFRAARHRSAFASIDAGRIWAVMPAKAEGATATDQVDLPKETARLLDQLNRAQERLNRCEEELASRRSQLFAEWHKYLQRAFPSLDETAAIRTLPSADRIREFMERDTIAGLADAQEKAKTAEGERNAARRQLSYNLPQGTNVGGLELRMVPEPRFWRPQEPVVLLSGDAADAQLHDTVDTKPECELLKLDVSVSACPEAVLEQASIFAHQASAATHPPWRPFLLEWQTRVHRSEDSPGRHVAHDPDFLTENFEPEASGLGLRAKGGARGGVSADGHTITGRSILTAGAQGLLLDKLWTVLERTLDDVLVSEDVSVEEEEPRPGVLTAQDPEEAASAARERWEWMLEQPVTYLERKIAAYRSLGKPHPILETLLSLYEKLQPRELPRMPRRAVMPRRPSLASGRRILTQPLSGFNDAILMRRKSMQLPVATPLGFVDEMAFAERVRELVGGETRSGPLPEAAFNPLRAGRLTLERLRLVDCFGRTQELSFDAAEVRVLSAMRDTDRPGSAILKPRFAQPARLKFRWLAAVDPSGEEEAEGETNSVADTSPVCGWMLHNHLDRDLAVFESDGSPIGTIDEDGTWRAPPGRPPTAIGEIADPALKRVVRWFIDAGQTRADHVQAKVESHLAGIEPEDDENEVAPAFLAGRPLIVARARIGLEIKGLPAVHQDWERFVQDMDRPSGSPRDCDGVDRIQVPVQIGDYGLLNDGLVAYWEESRQRGRIRIGDAHFADGDRRVSLSVGQSKSLTLLFDPRGAIHAASGLLPVKAMTLPPEYYARALRSLKVGFSVGPVIHPAESFTVPTPTVAGHVWEWAETRAGRTETVPLPERDPRDRRWGAGQRMTQGFLILARETREDGDG